MSLDGFVAGPDQSVENPLGVGGEQLHEWVVPLAVWRSPHGLPGGEVNESSNVVEQGLAGIGATIMGRNMFGGHPGPWDPENPWNGWWGDDPPFHHPVFVLTHHPREPLAREGGTTFTFVTDGIESALAQARQVAGGGDVALAGRPDPPQGTAAPPSRLWYDPSPDVFGSQDRYVSLQAARERRREQARLGDEIARLSAHIQAATYRLLELIRAFDATEGWRAEGFVTCAGWLSWRTGIAPGAAREKVRMARALGELPALSAALERGELSYSVARAITRVATPENEAELVEGARHATAAQMERVVGALRVVELAAHGEKECHEARALWVIPEEDGTWTIRGRLPAEVGALLCRALDAAGEALRGSAPVDSAEPAEARRVDALGLVAETALGGWAMEGRSAAPVASRAEHFQVVVHVSAETLSGTSLGDTVGSESMPGRPLPPGAVSGWTSTTRSMCWRGAGGRRRASPRRRSKLEHIPEIKAGSEVRERSGRPTPFVEALRSA